MEDTVFPDFFYYARTRVRNIDQTRRELLRFMRAATRAKRKDRREKVGAKIDGINMQ